MKINQLNHRTASAIIALTAILLITPICSAVNSKTITHSNASAFLKGETENTVIGSRGTISLAAQAADIDAARRGRTSVDGLAGLQIVLEFLPGRELHRMQ